ncbi:MAG: hypothetical protein KKI09_12960 [Spirochaetes bacterium]|nr:hypothetical protein [Spirochaetota bacterium]MBU0956332.1 hypothetical protein [Spirochaetota bacterium]
MSVTTAHYLSLLKVELRDLLEDISIVEDQLRKRFEAAEISSYVYRENDVVLRREMESIENFLPLIDAIRPDLYKDTELLVPVLLAELGIQLKRNGGPEAVVELVKRKMLKLSEFLRTLDS